jgi:isopentenyl phosphate kinase
VEDRSSLEKQTKALGLSKAKPTILKIGGSVITDKREELKARTNVIDRLASEIQRANTNNLVIVHGGGSFGHPIAQRYAIKDGLKEESQKIHFCETHHVMTVLNGLLMDALVWHAVQALSITPSSIIMTKNGRIDSFEETSLKKLLNMGFLPVMYGDAVLDAEIGFTILSGDQLVAALATRLNAERIIMGTDVDGLYSADPKVEKTASMLENLTLEELAKLQSKFSKSTAVDVTGGMFGKIAELLPALEHGVSVTVLNAAEPDRVYRALVGERVKGTLVRKE